MKNLEFFIQVTIALIIIMIGAQVLGRLARFIGQPAVVGEMISGVILGPTCFGYLHPEVSAVLFPKEIMPMLFTLSNIGLTAYMFLVGAEIDHKMFNKKAMKDATALSLAAIIVPFIFGAIAGYWFNDVINTKGIPSTSLIIFLGSALAITAFPMLARILQERNIVNTRIGVLSLLSASMQDVVSWIFLGVVTAMATTGDYTGVIIMVIGAIVLLLFLLFVVKPLLNRYAEKVTEIKDLPSALFGIVILLLLVCALITDWLGLYSVFGGFILGISLPRSGKFIDAITLRIKDLVVILFLPVFFAFSGLNTNILNLGNSLLVPTFVIIAFAFISKYFSSMLAMRLISGFSWRESSAIGSLINSRGLMIIIIANLGMMYELIDQNLYSILILIAITTTLAALPLYDLSLGKKQKNQL